MVYKRQQSLQKAKELFANKRYQAALSLLAPMTQQETNSALLGLVHGLMGKCCFYLEEYPGAILHLQTAQQHLPNDDKLHYFLGVIYLTLNQLDAAKHSFEQAVALNNQQESYHLNLGAVYRRLDLLDKAEQCYRAILQENPYATKAFRNLTLCLQYKTPEHPDRLEIESILKTQKLTNEEKAQCYFSLGKIYRDCQMPAQAVNEYHQANFFKNKIKGNIFSPTQYSQKIDEIIALFPEHCFHDTPITKSQLNPVFVIGIPRSGKTLLEKSLACPGVASLEEFGMIDKIVYEYGRKHYFRNLFVDFKQVISDALIRQFRTQYETQLYLRTTHAIHTFTDTTPCNFRYLGFISKMYPNAKIIHIIRDPFDHVLNIYFKYFSTGNFWAYDLSNIVHYYLEYRRLMAYWETSLAMPILTIRYEDLICNTDRTLESVYAFTQLDLKKTKHLTDFKAQLHTQEIQMWHTYSSFLKSRHYTFDKLKPYQSSVG